MSEIPADLLYTQSHEWLRQAADGSATVGITDHAQASLGDITYVQLPKPGDHFAAGQPFGVVESVKAASDLYAPLAMTVLDINAALETSPDLVNSAPHTDGWLLRVRPDDPGAAATLLDATAYAAIAS